MNKEQLAKTAYHAYWGFDGAPTPFDRDRWIAVIEEMQKCASESKTLKTVEATDREVADKLRSGMQNTTPTPDAEELRDYVAYNLFDKDWKATRVMRSEVNKLITMFKVIARQSELRREFALLLLEFITPGATLLSNKEIKIILAERLRGERIEDADAELKQSLIDINDSTKPPVQGA